MSLMIISLEKDFKSLYVYIDSEDDREKITEFTEFCDSWTTGGIPDEIKSLSYNLMEQEFADDGRKLYGAMHNSLTKRIIDSIKDLSVFKFLEIDDPSSAKERLRDCPRILKDYNHEFTTEIMIDISLLFFTFEIMYNISSAKKMSILSTSIEEFFSYAGNHKDIASLMSYAIRFMCETISFRIIIMALTNRITTLPQISEVNIRVPDRIRFKAIEHISNPKIIGSGYSSQIKTSEWGRYRHLGTNDSFLSNSLTFYDSDAKNLTEFVFHIKDEGRKGDEIVSTSNPISDTTSTVNIILHRWGTLHARLYFVITVILTKKLGKPAELNESDLIKFSGLGEDVKNGNLSIEIAREMVETALRDLSKLHVYIRKAGHTYSTGSFPVYQIEPLLFKLRKNGVYEMALHARFAPGLWAKDIFSYNSNIKALPIAPKITELPMKQNPIVAHFAFWYSFNSYRFYNNRKMRIRDILVHALPASVPHKSWVGLNITWEQLNPIGKLSQASKDARASIRRQFTAIPKTLQKYGLKVDYAGRSHKVNSSWEDFLETEVSVSLDMIAISNNKKGKPKFTREKLELPELQDLKGKLSKAGIRQAQVANCLRVTQSTVSNWLNGRTPIPPKAVVAILELCQSVGDSGG